MAALEFDRENGGKLVGMRKTFFLYLFILIRLLYYFFLYGGGPDTRPDYTLNEYYNYIRIALLFCAKSRYIYIYLLLQSVNFFQSIYGFVLAIRF